MLRSGVRLPDGSIYFPPVLIPAPEPLEVDRQNLVPPRSDEIKLVAGVMFILLFVLHYIFDFFILGYTAASFNKSFIHLHGDDCDDPTLKNGQFDYYLQVQSGLCHHEAPSDDGSDCIKWTDSEFWKEFDYQTTQEYAQDQASKVHLAYECAIAVIVFMTFSPIVRVIEIIAYPKMEYSVCLGNIYSLVMSWAVMIALIWYRSPCLTDSLPHGNQLIDEENWMIFHSCDKVTTTRLLAFSHTNKALGFTVCMAIARFFMICLIPCGGPRR